MQHTLSQLLEDINVNKKNLLRVTDSYDSPYPLYVVLKCLNGIDTLLLVNQINVHRNVSNTSVHDFLISAIPKKRRYNKWIKKQSQPDVDLIMKFYNYNRKKALSVLNILTTEQINEIKLRLNYDDCSSTRTKKSRNH